MVGISIGKGFGALKGWKCPRVGRRWVVTFVVLSIIDVIRVALFFLNQRQLEIAQSSWF